MGVTLPPVLRKRPGTVALLSAPVPMLITLVSMVIQLTPPTFVRLVQDPRALLGGGTNPWPAILGPQVGVAALLGLFVLLTVVLPTSPLLRWRSMRLKRAVAALFALLAGSTLWMGVIVGDSVWHFALQALPAVGMPTALDTPFWLYAALSLATAGLFYFFLKP